MRYLLIILILAGCSSAKELMDKAEKKDPAIVAKYARDKYPCTDLLKPDTAIIYQDSVVYIDCPENTTMFETVRTDTVNNVITKIVRVPVNMPVQVKTITKWYEDSAKVKICAVHVASLQADTASLNKQVTKYKGKVETRNKWLLWLIIVCACETLWILRKPILKLVKLII